MRTLSKGKRWMAVILSLCLIFTALPATVHAETESSDEQEKVQQTVSEGEQEVPEGYKPIYDGDELYAIRDDLSAKYILMNDIDLSKSTAKGGDLDFGNGWEPIQDFTGELDGNGYRIIGMHIFGDMNEKNVGLFGNVSVGEKEGPVIHDLGMKDCDIDVSNTGNVGGMIGCLEGSTYENQIIVENCFVTGKINATHFTDDSYRFIGEGGLIGKIIASYSPYPSTRSLQSCYNAASVLCDNTGICVGGLVGHIGYGISFVQCYNLGELSGGNAIATGTNEGNRGYYQNCYYLTGTASTGAEGKNDDSTGIKAYSDIQMKNRKLYTGFDFDNTWEFDPYCIDYLYPQLKTNRQIRATQLQITAMPSKTSYQQCDQEDFSDGKIKVLYENSVETELPMTKATLSGYDMNQIGEQEVTVSYAGCDVTFPIEVTGVDVTEVTLNKTALNMNVRETQQLTASIAPENASNKEIIWESSDPKVATVSSTGLVQALAKGKTTITVYSYDKAKSATCEVEVFVPCVEISLDEEKLELSLGEDETLTASMLPFETTDMVKWSSADDTVATVDEYGKVTAVGAGVTTITATADSGVKAECIVKVKIPATGIVLSEKTKTMYLGDQAVLEAELVPADSTDEIWWSSDDEDIVSVDDEGNITANGIGTTRIVVYTEDNLYSDSCLVTVVERTVAESPDPAATGATSPAPTVAAKPVINLNYNTQTLNVGEGVSLLATGTDGKNLDNERLTWSSSDKSIATVDTQGTVISWAKGTVTITVKDNKKEYEAATCLITVIGTDTTKDSNAAKQIKVARKIKVKIKKVSKIKRNSAELSFSVSNGPAAGFHVQVYSRGRLIKYKYLSGTTKYKLKGLKRNKTYSVRVRSRKWVDDDYYYGSWSAAKKFKTRY